MPDGWQETTAQSLRALRSDGREDGPGLDWSDPLVHHFLRTQGDGAADACAAALKSAGARGIATREFFASLRQNDSRPHVPVETQAPRPAHLTALLDFWQNEYPYCDGCKSDLLPSWVDRPRLVRGQQAFMTHMLPAIIALLCKSLPEGYAAPSISKVLSASEELESHTYRRLMGTLQLLITVASPYSFERAGRAHLVATEMRLMHAGIRMNVLPQSAHLAPFGDYLREWDVPISQHDMLGTLMGFSLLVVEGLRTMKVPLNDASDDRGRSADPDTEADYYYVWRVFGVLMGLHPPDEPESDAYIPRTLDEAAEFYAKYKEICYVGATTHEPGWLEKSIAANADGVKLAEAHLSMMKSVALPALLRFIPFRYILRVYVYVLSGAAACARVGIDRVSLHSLAASLLIHFPAWFHRRSAGMNPRLHVALSETILEWLVHAEIQTGVAYGVPMKMSDVKNIVESSAADRR